MFVRIRLGADTLLRVLRPLCGLPLYLRRMPTPNLMLGGK
ncbi:MAG: hypothetical protein RLZ68_179 [Pseudomonadota bacterium]